MGVDVDAIVAKTRELPLRPGGVWSCLLTESISSKNRTLPVPSKSGEEVFVLRYEN
jgi:hypothetical protein